VRATPLGLLAALGATLAMTTGTPASAASFSVSAWGENHFGELGDGNRTTTDLPTATDGLSDVVSVAAGGKHALALLSNGTVMGWGANLFGQLCTTAEGGDTPVPASGLSEPSELAAGSSDTLVLVKDGTVLACGENNLGQLGNGTIGHGGPAPRPVSGLSGVTAVAARGDSSYALLEDGTVMAWGDNGGGQFGDGTTTSSDVPVPVSDLSAVSAISAGSKFALALLKNGTVMAWGYNKHGELGDGSTAQSLTPVPVSGLREVTAISAGGNGALALLKNGTVMAWGYNKCGQLGNGTTNPSDVPVAVKGLSDVTEISAGGEYGMALLSDGAVMTWGHNEYGELGNGNIHNTDLPAPVLGISEVAGIATGSGFSVAYGPDGPTLAGPTISDAHGYGPTAGGTSVSITGTNFNEVTAVEFGSARASFHVNSPTSITAVSPPGETGRTTVSVTTTVATTTLSQLDVFTYVPTIAKLQADSGLVAGGKKVTITGSGFATGTSATGFFFGEAPATSVECSSTTVCTALAPAHAAGGVAVRALVNGVHSRLSPADRYTYT